MSTAPTETGSPKRRLGDLVFANLTRAAGVTILVTLAGVALFLTIQGLPGITASSEDLKGHANFLGYVAPLVFGTLLAAVIALLIALPLAIGVALSVSHFAPRSLSIAASSFALFAPAAFSALPVPPLSSRAASRNSSLAI